MVDSTLHTRRKFLRTSILGGAMAWTLPGFIDRTFAALGTAADGSLVQTATGKDSPILVILQMSGGNDGLNTVIPFTDDAYHRVRPRIGVAEKSALRLTDHIGLHPEPAKACEFFRRRAGDRRARRRLSESQSLAFPLDGNLANRERCEPRRAARLAGPVFR